MTVNSKAGLLSHQRDLYLVLPSPSIPVPGPRRPGHDPHPVHGHQGEHEGREVQREHLAELYDSTQRVGTAESGREVTHIFVWPIDNCSKRKPFLSFLVGP